MQETTSRDTEELRSRYRRALRAGVAVSLCLHLALFLLFRGAPQPTMTAAAAGPRSGDDRAAALGGGMRAVTLRTVPPAEEAVVRPPEPIPVPEPVAALEPEPEAAPVAFDFEALGAGMGPALGAGAEAGLEDGAGRGAGGSAAEGRAGTPPAPRSLILPPGDRPRRVRGKEVSVWVYVAEDGAVVADSTRLFPPTGDAGFDERLREQAARWTFEPARRGGRAVAEWFRYVITL